MALKVEDLRIGNLVFVDGVERTIVELKTRMASLRFRRKDTELPHQSMFDYQDIVGIPLTEDWLLKFGFRPFKNDFAKKGIVIHNRKRGFVLRKSVPDILYVHQLQNLYHALTGQELTA